MKLCRFNQKGIQQFENYLATLRITPTLPVPKALLDDPSLTEPLSSANFSEVPKSLPTRMDFAIWLYTESTKIGVEIPRNDNGFWAWLSLALFEHVCPADAQGRRKPGANARHIVDSVNWRRRYRHLLRSAYEVFYLHRDDPARAYVALINPLNKPGELTEQIIGRQEILTCPGCISLATFLCIDSNRGRRKGASGEFARVFGKAVNRLSRTFDLPVMQPSQSARLLHQTKLRRFVDAAMKESS